TKDGATGCRQLPGAAGKNAKQNDYATGGRCFSRAVGKKRATKDGATGGRQLPGAAGKNAKQNDYAHGARRISRAPSKNEKEISL
ncbi:MAG: hypothetical protein PUA87_07725, partial [Oscillospiraceae bacterium]|nr:hypothetical protein [Oscillospiraceae bacterium]